MADYNSELPIRSQLPGQVLSDDVIIKIGDATNPTTQMASVDTFGSLQSKIADASGNVIASQDLSATYWLQTVTPSNGSAAGGTAAVFSNLAGGIYNSTLPTLTNGLQASLQLDAAGRLIVDLGTPIPAGSNTIGAVTQASGPWTMNLTEVSGTAIVLGQATMAASLPVAIASNQSAIPVSQSGSWTVAVTQSTSPWVISGTVTADQGGAPWSVTDTNFPATVDTNYGTVGASTIRTAAQIGNATGAADFNNGATDAQTLRVAANLAVAGANVSLSNPVPVTITSASSGTPIQNFQTSSTLAVGSNVNLTYTVPATHTFSLERIWASSEARMKVTVTINTVESYVGFNSSANPNLDITVTAPPTLTAGETVVVNFKNIDTGASDVYVTIEGNQIS